MNNIASKLPRYAITLVLGIIIGVLNSKKDKQTYIDLLKTENQELATQLESVELEPVVENNPNTIEDPIDTEEKDKETISEPNVEATIPSYEVVSNEVVRHDGATSYQILIEELEIGVDDHRQISNAIVRDMISKYGSKIDVDIFDNREVLDLYRKQYIDLSLDRARTPEENKLLGRHLIATYVGELDSAEQKTSISYFIAMYPDHELIEYSESFLDFEVN